MTWPLPREAHCLVGKTLGRSNPEARWEKESMVITEAKGSVFSDTTVNSVQCPWRRRQYSRSETDLPVWASSSVPLAGAVFMKKWVQMAVGEREVRR